MKKETVKKKKKSIKKGLKLVPNLQKGEEGRKHTKRRREKQKTTSFFTGYFDTAFGVSQYM